MPSVHVTAGGHEWEVTLPDDSHPLYVAQILRDIAASISRRIEETP